MKPLSPSQTSPPATPQPADDNEYGLKSFASIDRLHQSLETDEEMPDLSFLDDWRAEDSMQSPESSQHGPGTPSPGETLSRFIGRSGVFHEITAVIVDDDLRENDDAMREERGGDATTWTCRRLRGRPTELSVVENNDNIWVNGPLVDSIERDVSVAFHNGGSVTPSVEVEVGDRDLGGDDSDYNAYAGVDYDVKRIVGERIMQPNVHEYRIQWLGDDSFSWVPASNCSCPDAIDEFRALQREELLAALLAGREDEVENLQRLAEAASAEAENAVFLKHPRWRVQRRNEKGRFATRGASNTILEISRQPTVPCQLRANTARPPTVHPVPNNSDGNDESNEDAIVWVCTRPREGRRFRESDLKAGGQEDMDVLCEQGSHELEGEEMDGGREDNVDGQRRTMAKEAAEREKRRMKREKARRRAGKRERKEASKREEEGRKLKSRERKVARKERRRQKAEERAAEEKKQEVEAEMRHRKEVLERERAQKKKLLEETVRKYNYPTIVKDQGGQKGILASKNRKWKIQQTLAEASASAFRQENALLAASASLINQVRAARASSSSSILSTSTKFRNARANEARTKAIAKPSLVRSEFRKTLGKRQAEAMISQSKIIPPRRRE